MATYKVLQDIEGEDKLIAWLSPKQTIYAAIVIVSGILAFFMGQVHIVLALPWILPIVVFGFLAAPLRKDQPNDVWLAAIIRFYLKPHKRIWNQSGMEELVHITAPKKLERFYTDGLEQTEVRSRLKALSATIDSRGWVIKNSPVNLGSNSVIASQFTPQDDDRLIASPQIVAEDISGVDASEDILDADNNTVAKRFDQQIKQQEEFHKKALRDSMQNSQSSHQQNSSATPVADDFYFLREQAVTQAPVTINTQAQQLATFSPQVVAPGQQDADAQSTATSSTADDNDPSAQALLEKIHHDQEVAQDITAHSHEKVIKTPSEIAEADRLALESKNKQALATKTAPDAIIKELSREASDLKVSTIATQAKHASENKDDGEVVISLH